MNKRSLLAWFLVSLVVVLSFVQLFLNREAAATSTIGSWILALINGVLPAFFLSLVGGLIVSRQGGNRVGLLLILASLGGANPSGSLFRFPAAPAALTPSLWLLLWFDNWSWMIFIFPLFLIPLNFPDGRLPGPRWRWVNLLAAGMIIFLVMEIAFRDEIGPINASWSLPNPIGFIPSGFIDGAFIYIWVLGLMMVVGGSVASLFARYRRAGQVEQDQIKWMLFGGVVFFMFYGLIVATVATGSIWFGEAWTNTALTLGVLAFPISIAIAILRYRLYDINVIIRRTLQYSILTVLISLIYFGSIVIFQQVFEALTGETNSPLIAVVSTLIIAALFNPLRKRIQGFIDRCFYRKKSMPNECWVSLPLRFATKWMWIYLQNRSLESCRKPCSPKEQVCGYGCLAGDLISV